MPRDDTAGSPAASRELKLLAGRWGLALDGLVATGTVPAGEEWDGTPDPEDWVPPRDESALLDDAFRSVPGTLAVDREDIGDGLVAVRIELVPDGERELPEDWSLEAGGVSHFGPGGWVFSWFADGDEAGPGTAVVHSGEDGTEKARERVGDLAGASTVFGRFGTHW